MLTEFGQVDFTCRIYIDEFGDRRTWLDEILSLRRRLSPAAQGALCLFGAQVPYGRAAETLFRHTPQAVSAMTAMSALRETGDLLETEALCAREELFGKGIAPKSAVRAREIFVEADGVFVPLARRKDRSVEIKALCAYAGKKDGSRAGCVLIGYIENNQESIDAAAPSLGTMEGTNAHLYGARMKVWGGAWSREGASGMARIRAALFSGETLPVPKRDQDFSERDRKRREALRDKLRYEFKYEMIRSEGKGYEPPQGHLMPFSTRQTHLAMFDPRNRG